MDERAAEIDADNGTGGSHPAEPEVQAKEGGEGEASE